MSSDSSDEDNFLLYLYYKNKRRYIRRFWVHPYIEKILIREHSLLLEKLHENDDKKFRHFYRMSKESYYYLVQLQTPNILKKITTMRDCVTDFNNAQVK